MTEEHSNCIVEGALDNFDANSTEFSQDAARKSQFRRDSLEIKNSPGSLVNCDTSPTSLHDRTQPTAEHGEHPRKSTSQKLKSKVGGALSSTSCNLNSSVKKSNSHINTASPIMFNSFLTKEESPSKAREREEKLRVLRERKLEEQKKKEEELKESIARAEEVRKRQEEERRRRTEELRKREVEHRAHVEERRRKLWDEEFERRQAILKKTAERDARIDFKKPYKSALGLSKSCGHSDGTLSSGTARTHIRSLLSPSSMSRHSPPNGVDEATNDKSKSSGRVHKSREATRRSVVASGCGHERPRSFAPSYSSSTVSFRIRAGQGVDCGTGVGGGDGAWTPCVCPRFRSTSPSKSRAHSMGNVQRNKIEASHNASQTPRVSGLPNREKVQTSKTPVPREKTPARVSRQSVPASSTSPNQTLDRSRSRRSKTLVVGKPAEDNKEAAKASVNSARSGVMVKSMECAGSLQSRNGKMRSSWAPGVQKEQEKEKEKEKPSKPKPSAVKAVPKKAPLAHQKSENHEESKVTPVESLPVSSADAAPPSKPEEVVAKESPGNAPVELVAKKLSQVEEHQRKLAENRRLARERAEQKAEEERLRQEKLKREEEERQRREEEEAKRQEEEELRQLEEAQRLEQERYLKAVEQENERKKMEEERLEVERAEKLIAEAKAKEEAEKLEKEREEKRKKMAEEKEERKRKLEMIMKRVKTDEPTKVDSVQSPTGEGAAAVPQSPSVAPDVPAKSLPVEVVREEFEASSNFKSPLLQKMLGSKLKGNAKVFSSPSDDTTMPGKTAGTTSASAEPATRSFDDVTLAEDSKPKQDVKESEETDDRSLELPEPPELLSLEALPARDDSTKIGHGTLASDSNFLQGAPVPVEKTPSSSDDVGCEYTDADILEAEIENEKNNKEPSSEREEGMPATSMDEIHCLIEVENDVSLTPRGNDTTAQVKVDEENHRRSSNDNVTLPGEAESPSTYVPIGENKTPAAVGSPPVDRIAENKDSSKSNNVASDEDNDDEDSNDSENSQVLTTLPSNLLDSVKKLEGCLEEETKSVVVLNNSDDSKNVSSEGKERGSLLNPLGAWSADLDGTSVLSNIFVGQCMPHNDGSGTGDGLQNNFVIASTILE